MRFSSIGLIALLVGGCAVAPPPPPPLRPPPAHVVREPGTVIMPDVIAAEHGGRWDARTCGELITRLEHSSDAQSLVIQRGVVLDRCGRTEDARAAMLDAAKRNDGAVLAKIWLVLDDVQSKGDTHLDEAAERLRRLILEDEFRTSYGLVALSRIQRRIAFVRPKEAERMLADAERNLLRACVVPDAGAMGWAELALYHLERAGTHSGVSTMRTMQALDVVRAGLERTPGSALLHVVLGRVEMMRREYEAARVAFGQAVVLDVEVVGAHVGLGHALLQLHRFDEAADRFRAALERQPEHYEALVGLAIVHRHAGELGEAATLLQRARALAPLRPSAHFEIGLVSIAQGGRASPEARVSLRRFLELSDEPGFVPARELAVSLLGGER